MKESGFVLPIADKELVEQTIIGLDKLVAFTCTATKTEERDSAFLHARYLGMSASKYLVQLATDAPGSGDPGHLQRSSWEMYLQSLKKEYRDTKPAPDVTTEDSIDIVNEVLKRISENPDKEISSGLLIPNRLTHLHLQVSDLNYLIAFSPLSLDYLLSEIYWEAACLDRFRTFKLYPVALDQNSILMHSNLKRSAFYGPRCSVITLCPFLPEKRLIIQEGIQPACPPHKVLNWEREV